MPPCNQSSYEDFVRPSPAAGPTLLALDQFRIEAYLTVARKLDVAFQRLGQHTLLRIAIAVIGLADPARQLPAPVAKGARPSPACPIWSKDFLEDGKKRLAGDTARAATSDEVKDLRRKASALNEARFQVAFGF
jgi:hypothetical protein